MKKLLLIIAIMFFLVGCSSSPSFVSISGEEALELVNNNEAIIIDVRNISEYEDGHIENAINIPLDTIDLTKLQEVISSKDSNIIVYCASGIRSKNAATVIASFGYTNVYDLGSINSWSGDIE